MTDEVAVIKCSCGEPMTQLRDAGKPGAKAFICRHCDGPCVKGGCKRCAAQARSLREG